MQDYSSMRNNPRVVSPRSTLDSVDKALSLLMMLRRSGEVRVVDVSRELGVAPSTAHRLLTTLVVRGFAEQDRASRSYRAGRVLIELGLSAVGDLDIRREARRYLLRLAAEVGETVHLLVLEGFGVRFIDGVESSHLIRVASRIGVLLPAHTTSGGKLLLAYASEQRREALLLGRLKRITRDTLVHPDTLADELDDIKRLGYAMNRGESDEELRAIAVGVRGGRGDVVAALAIAVPVARGSAGRLREFLEPLYRYADAIGRTV